MKKSDNLYFIALLPPEEIRQEVKAFKEYIKEHYEAKHALKSPAHITLQMPFRESEEQEERLIETLAAFSSRQKPFPVELMNFKSFPPRVIYIAVCEAKAIKDLHEKLKQVLQTRLDFPEKLLSTDITPHMTIATRDLDQSAFKKAWDEFKGKSFQATFEVKALVLLKHNGKFWDVFREFPFDRK